MGAAMQSDQTAEESMMRKTDLALQNDFVIWQIPSNFMSLKLGENIFDKFRDCDQATFAVSRRETESRAMNKSSNSLSGCAHMCFGILLEIG